MPLNHKGSITATALFTVIDEACKNYLNPPSSSSSKKKGAQCSTTSWEGHHGKDGEQRAARLLEQAQDTIFATDLFKLIKYRFERGSGNWGARSLKSILLEKLVQAFGPEKKTKRNKIWALRYLQEIHRRLKRKPYEDEFDNYEPYLVCLNETFIKERNYFRENEKHALIIARGLWLLKKADGQHFTPAVKEIFASRPMDVTLSNMTLLWEDGHYAEGLSRGFAMLQRADLLNQENVTLLFEHAKEAGSLSGAFIELCAANLLNQENITLLCNQTYSVETRFIEAAFSVLQQGRLLNQNNVNLLSQGYWGHVKDLSHALTLLHHAQLVNQDNITLLCQNDVDRATDLSRAFDALFRAGLLNQDNINLLYQRARYLSDAFIMLQNAGLLKQNIVTLLSQYAEDAWDLSFST